jgi:hypothetical protein
MQLVTSAGRGRGFKVRALGIPLLEAGGMKEEGQEVVRQVGSEIGLWRVLPKLQKTQYSPMSERGIPHLRDFKTQCCGGTKSS